MILVQAVNIVPAVTVILNVLPGFVVTDVGIGLQAIPAIRKLVIIMVAHGGQLPGLMRDIKPVRGINIAPVPAPVAAAPGVVGPAGRVGPFTLLVVLPNTVPAAVV